MKNVKIVLLISFCLLEISKTFAGKNDTLTDHSPSSNGDILPSNENNKENPEPTTEDPIVKPEDPDSENNKESDKKNSSNNIVSLTVGGGVGLGMGLGLGTAITHIANGQQLKKVQEKLQHVQEDHKQKENTNKEESLKAEKQIENLKGTLGQSISGYKGKLKSQEKEFKQEKNNLNDTMDKLYQEKEVTYHALVTSEEKFAQLREEKKKLEAAHEALNKEHLKLREEHAAVLKEKSVENHVGE